MTEAGQKTPDWSFRAGTVTMKVFADRKELDELAENILILILSCMWCIICKPKGMHIYSPTIFCAIDQIDNALHFLIQTLSLFWLFSFPNIVFLFPFSNTIIFQTDLMYSFLDISRWDWIFYILATFQKCHIYIVITSRLGSPSMQLFLPLLIKHPGHTTKACGSGVSSLAALKVARKPPLWLLSRHIRFL